MSLPADIARCPGQRRKVKDGEWPFPHMDLGCMDCARRQQGIADYMAGNKAATWMEPPDAQPCPEKLERKK